MVEIFATKLVILSYLLIIIIGSCCCFGSNSGISCKDDNGNSVDWWIALKTPDGYSYAYADSNSHSLTGSLHEFNQQYTGALGSTLKQIYENSGSSDVGYLLYNDESPDGNEHDSYGHTKGDLAFDERQGFWLVHSVPRFPVISSDPQYNYPHNESIFGQSFFCLSLNITSLNLVGYQFLINKPFVYDSNIPDSLIDNIPNLVDVINDKFVEKSRNNTLSLTTLSGSTEVISFAKNKNWGLYLYEDFVEKYYKSGFMIETWMNGAKKNQMPTFCTPEYEYDSINVRMVSLPTFLQFSETHDHSKWAISTQVKGIVCIGDINRQFSQSERGGGTVCMKNYQLWNSFTQAIKQADSC